MILNIRGTNGSGKSTLVRAIMGMFPYRPIYGILGPKKPEAYYLTLPKNKDKLRCIDISRENGVQTILQLLEET